MPIMAPVTSFGMSGGIPGSGGGQPEDDWDFGGGGAPTDDPDIRERQNEWTIQNSLW